MSDNPYQPPQATGGAIEVTDTTREQLRAVASSQRAIMYCILAQLLLMAALIVFPQIMLRIPLELRQLVWVMIYVATAICLGRMAARLHSTGQGILYGILGLIPLVSLICLFVVNQRATKLLTRHGVRVGLMGADPSEI